MPKSEGLMPHEGEQSLHQLIGNRGLESSPEVHNDAAASMQQRGKTQRFCAKYIAKMLRICLEGSFFQVS